jgi:hypothetical protein
MRLSLLKKILIAICLITIAALVFIWFFVRPKYEASVIAERLNAVRQLQKSSIDNLDHTITGWSHIPRFIIAQVTERPNEGETILRMMMSLHPEIIEMRIHSSGPSDELMSRDTTYPLLNLQFSDSIWEQSKVDGALQIKWLNRNEIPLQLLAMQMHFQVNQMPFTLTVVWNAKRLSDILAGFPFEKEYSVSICSSSGIIARNISPFNLDEIYTSINTSDTVQIVHEGIHSWHVLTSALKSAQLWLVVAIPGNIFIKPFEDFLLYSAVLIVGPMLVLTILGWLLSYQIRRFIKKMKKTISATGN